MSGGPYDDLERRALSPAGLTRDLVRLGSPWRRIQVVRSTGSTNADLSEAARAGAAAGLVLIAEEQTAGRGRLDRPWVAPRGSGLTFSVLLKPTLRLSSWGWLSLLAGMGVADPLARLTGLDIQLKWPNDLLIGQRKVAGILAERVGDQLVLGVGLNVSLRSEELPAPQATSLAIEGSAVLDRQALVGAMLRGIGERVADFTGTEEAIASARAAYRVRCATLGCQVRAELPGGGELVGWAVDVDDSGRLLIEGPDGTKPVSAGDVVHLR